ncbi:AraC family transcriptional regulator [Clostridium chauvoei]|uniref:HTH araC/xylS-type domain-containing protein n=2 Tax=Clostridium chauvoei TaxID=46867 RepID=S6FBQ8_9CLOT|nr:AraC family transcriptional regulator [Clostridium chauvoei]ATD55755.1 hypothetical protein BTM20_11125 [Clostridium chauvoei]ATD56569.1 hypothetical protein BTM21_01895 [Clostridium chauvoei]MBX7280300.1 AraC family transcriptional regulator [Clostridium chauvoei]MBX7282785.1 AraC family transcriptional regulator [Clostridium chauvoei]MBX7285191.1 AraC family transcriptional regulator [Clostridium chauvoei]
MNTQIQVFTTDKQASKELYIYECGYEECKPRIPYQYEQIDYYLIHYVLSGEGLFFINGEVYKLKKGDGFLIPPHTDNNYYPDTNNPWCYRWIGINGSEVSKILKSCGFNNSNFTFNYTDDNFVNNCFKNILDGCNNDQYFQALGNLYLFFNQLILKNNNLSALAPNSYEKYISLFVDYIRDNYHQNISISDISNHLNINRSHLFKLIKKHMNISPQEYLINYRLNKACDLLRKSSYSISEISYLVGFNSPSYFSKIFSKYFNKSPMEYRSMFIKQPTP